MVKKTAMLVYAMSLTVLVVQAQERVQCSASADSWVESPPWEPHARESRNYGSDRDLILNGRNSFALLAFDMSPAKGLRIEKAVLRVHRRPDPIPLTMVGISTISGSGPWSEVEVNYFFARKGQPWSYPGGRTYWNYASTNHPRETNVGMRAWCWRAWVAGADAIVPWNTVQGMEAWDRAEPLTVFYVGKKFGRNEPFDCLRLKAFRRGEQDVEYMTLLARRKSWDRDAVAHAVAETLDLSEETRRQYEEDAGSIRFDGIADTQLDQLRRRVAAALLK